MPTRIEGAVIVLHQAVLEQLHLSGFHRYLALDPLRSWEILPTKLIWKGALLRSDTDWLFRLNHLSSYLEPVAIALALSDESALPQPSGSTSSRS